jgi:NAD(P)-dependent dehydrogenase (short-subunit alcohol dehydrogenase family)
VSPEGADRRPRRFAGRVVLVFGAGASGPGWGNGKAAAVLYAREGASVVAVDVVAAAAAATAAIIADEGGEALALTADVTASAAVGAVIDQCLARFGHIDVLHNNVGMTDMADLEAIDDERWRAGLDLNLTGAFLACRQVLPVMLRQARGVIINISSLASERVNAYPYFSYYAAKAGLNQLTRALAVHYGARGIRVNAVLPGVMDTPLIYSQIAGQHADVSTMRTARSRRVPMARMGDAWDVARAALFLASDDAAYITGVCLPVDGGLSCCSGTPEGGFAPVLGET